MVIEVYTNSALEEMALLDFLNSRHYTYKSTEDSELTDAEFIDQYNKELDEAEAEIDAGNYFTHEEVKKIFADKKSGIVEVKWSKAALEQLDKALDFIIENGFESYAAELEKSILLRVEKLVTNFRIYPADKYKKDNDGSYRAFELDEYRISFKVEKSEIKIIRIRHTSRKPRKY